MVREIVFVGVGPERAAIVTIHDDANLLHRALVGAPHLVGIRVPQLAPGEEISVDGVLTRDAAGKVWIASRLTHGDVSVPLRDDSGQLLWTELSAGLLPASFLKVATVITEAGTVGKVVGWTLNRETRHAVLRVDVNGAEVYTGWTAPTVGEQP